MSHKDKNGMPQDLDFSQIRMMHNLYSNTQVESIEQMLCIIEYFLGIKFTKYTAIKSGRDVRKVHICLLILRMYLLFT